jgi:hypothetical protein
MPTSVEIIIEEINRGGILYRVEDFEGNVLAMRQSIEAVIANPEWWVRSQPQITNVPDLDVQDIRGWYRRLKTLRLAHRSLAEEASTVCNHDRYIELTGHFGLVERAQNDYKVMHGAMTMLFRAMFGEWPSEFAL